ncbi:hypothetical protein [Saccharothrix syringae]|uniref:hypothetical protein n=1 Tax=Saccharothrix syringae TaxID=103733 RepID=UPI001292EEF5|nr:hypothetical protein [Saccharothrix syringae]
MYQVVLVLLVAMVVAAIGLMARMFAKDEPFYGVVALGVLAGPGSLLALAHLAVA